jgi:hypothetical protein
MASPDELTVRTAAFEDCQVACVVTASVDPFESVAVAVSWLVEPTVGAVPETAMDATVGVDGAEGADGLGAGALVEVEPQAHIASTATISVALGTTGTCILIA